MDMLRGTFGCFVGNADFSHAATVLDLDWRSTKAEKRRSYNPTLYKSWASTRVRQTQRREQDKSFFMKITLSYREVVYLAKTRDSLWN